MSEQLERPVILVVEDEPTTRLSLKHVLERDGYQVTECSDGQSALALFSDVRPSLVLLDVIMPVLDGVTVCSRIRLLPGGEDVPVIMLTALDDAQSIQDSFRAGADDYVTKPIQWSVLRQRVQRILHIHQSDQQRRTREQHVIQQHRLDSLKSLATHIAGEYATLIETLDDALTNLQAQPLPLETASALEQLKTASDAMRAKADHLLVYTGRKIQDQQAVYLGALASDFQHTGPNQADTPIRLYRSNWIPPVAGNIEQLRDVLRSLVDTMRTVAGDQAGTITIRTTARRYSRDDLATWINGEHLPPGEYVTVEVASDSKKTFEPDTLHLFDPFRQRANGDSGLVTALGIVRSHNGAMQLTSPHAGGVTISVVLPAEIDQPVSVEEEPIDNEPLPNGTVLVIDKDHEARTVVARMLEQCGFDVLTADDGRAGVDVFRSYADLIVCVLLDLNGNTSDGTALFSALRSVRPQVPLVGMHHPGAAIDVVLRNDQHTSFIQKPFSARFLRQTLHQALATADAQC